MIMLRIDFLSMERLGVLRAVLVAVVVAVGAWQCVWGELTAMRGKCSGGYDFWLYSPDAAVDSVGVDSTATAVGDSVSRGKPLVIFLHGQSLCGRNLDRVLRYGTMAALKGGRRVDAFVVAPQNPGGAWKPERVAEVMDWAVANCDVDTSRVYVLGMSLGGYGTIDFVAAYPERVAAAMALCGGGTAKDFSGLCGVPLWIIHGTADRAVSVNESRKVREAMRRSGGTDLLRYDEWAGVNHGRLARVLYLEDTYRWLLDHSLGDVPRRVNREVVITNESLKDAYQGLKLNKSGKKKGKKGKSRKRRSR